MDTQKITERIDEKQPEKLKEQLKKIANEGNSIAKSLKKIFGRAKQTTISKETAELGLLFFTRKKDSWRYAYEIYESSEVYKKFQRYDLEKLWDGEHYLLLEFLFGKEIAPYVKKAWETINKYMYQKGYDRRSFRRLNHQTTTELSRLNFIIELIYRNTKYHDFSLTESIKYDNILGQNSSIARVWAMAIDEGNKDVFNLMKDIILGDAEKGTVSRNIIISLLYSNKKEAWELVGDLLISAQRQEGLRQTILETLDETSVGAFEYILDLIVEHKLIRFSAVVRALDVWAGFGWESEKQSTTKRFMELAQKYFKNPELLEKAINDKDNAEVFMALWGQGSHDIDKCYPYLKTLYKKGTIEKKTLVLYFVNQTEIREWNQEFGKLAIYEEQPQLQYWGNRLIATKNIEEQDKLIELYFNLYDSFGEKNKIEFKGKVFSWLNFDFKKVDIIDLIDKEDEEKMQRLLSLFKGMEIENREQIVRKILNEYTGYYGYYQDDDKNVKPPTTRQRDFAFTILKDRSEYIRGTAMRTLSFTKLSKEEIQIFEDLLTRKSADFRKFVLKMILDRPTNEIFESAERLIVAKNVEQRLAGLDLLTILNKDEENENRVKTLANSYAERLRIGKKEQILLDVLLAEKTVEYNEENGFGLYDPNRITPLKPLEKPKSGEYFEKIKGKHPFGFSKSISEIGKDIQDLTNLIKANENYEYVTSYDEKVLLGNEFYQLQSLYRKENITALERFENYPLANLWEEWYQKSGLLPSDLHFIIFNVRAYPNKYHKNLFPKTQAKIEKLIPTIRAKDNGYVQTAIKIIEILSEFHSYEKANEFFVGFTIESLLLIDPSEMSVVKKDEKRHWNKKFTVFDSNYVYKILNTLNRNEDKNFEGVWNIDQFVHQNTPKEAEKRPTLKQYCKAYEKNLCTKDELIKRIMTDKEAIRTLTFNTESEKSWRSKETKKYYEEFPFLKEIIEKAKARILEIELKRGDTETSVTHLASSLQSVYGIDYFIEILTALGKDKLNRGYYYYSSGSSKKDVLSSLLYACYPLKRETQEEFNEKITKAKFTEKRLIEVALYARQWLPFIAKHIGWKGFESAVWWLDAHTNQYSYAGKETEVARYSNISMERFGDGVVDFDWFVDVYKMLGKKRWKALYDSAKYISDGTGHTRAKLYADVITGDVKIREITKRVKDKRNQDFVRVYGLVPLSKTVPKKDLLGRYNYLLQFLKESKQFGSQRQASEALAVEIAMENLARTAGYPDPIRLTWAMETEEAKTIISNAETLQFDDYTIELQVDELGKAHLVSKRGNKVLKSIPSKFKKEKSLIELKDFYKRLKNQYSRSRKSLEEAMVRGDEFQVDEIQNLSEHPVISPMLSALALISDENIGFYKDGKLIDEQGNTFDLGKSTRIAHCTDFYKKGNWTDLQRYCFDNKIVQPFKQIFRELYVPTADELQEKNISRRYAGHQVQPKKTVALLKTRGWTVDYEEGLQRVYHKAGLIAKMYAMADWFSPADTESPTLETVEFYKRKDFKRVTFTDISPLIFSEVMRDVDLVISVAHVGGVDPEASHSTVEMRTAIIRETARLFKLDNVKIEGHHAHIKGHFGEYSVHLGSAVTHMKPGKYLSILPVHSQHRGRLFLPFVDDDPRSAELMSKILLLAKDKEIKDPMVLKQIQG